MGQFILNNFLLGSLFMRIVGHHTTMGNMANVHIENSFHMNWHLHHDKIVSTTSKRRNIDRLLFGVWWPNSIQSSDDLSAIKPNDVVMFSMDRYNFKIHVLNYTSNHQRLTMEPFPFDNYFRTSRMFKLYKWSSISKVFTLTPFVT